MGGVTLLLDLPPFKGLLFMRGWLVKDGLAWEWKPRPSQDDDPKLFLIENESITVATLEGGCQRSDPLLIDQLITNEMLIKHDLMRSSPNVPVMVIFF